MYVIGVLLLCWLTYGTVPLYKRKRAIGLIIVWPITLIWLVCVVTHALIRKV